MSTGTKGDSIPHEVRTSTEPRQNQLIPVRVAQVEQANPTIRLIRLALADNEDTCSFLPGQWVDVHIPSIKNAGGFTITSIPDDARPSSTISREDLAFAYRTTDDPSNGRYKKTENGHLELAVQNSPTNPPAAWLWKPKHEILNQELTLRIGGRFVWPPLSMGGPLIRQIEKVVFVAGGIGINPLISMISHIFHKQKGLINKNGRNVTKPEQFYPQSLHLLYSTRLPQVVTSLSSIADPRPKTITHDTLTQILFLPRLQHLVDQVYSPPSSTRMTSLSIGLFLTNACSSTLALKPNSGIDINLRRITSEDLTTALTPGHLKTTVCFVCGPPAMTDSFVKIAGDIIGAERVFCEKWW